MGETAFAECRRNLFHSAILGRGRIRRLNLPFGDFLTASRIPLRREKKRKVDGIAVEGVTEYQPRAGGVVEGYFEVKRNTVEGKGTASPFDRGEGRYVRLELELKLEGT